MSRKSRPKVKIQFLHFAILAFFCILGLYNLRSLIFRCPEANQSCCFIYHFDNEQGGLDKKITLHNQMTLKLFSVLQFGTSSERYQSNYISNETDDDSDCYVCTRELAGAPNYSVGYNCCLSDTPPPPPWDPQMLRCSDAQITKNKNKSIELLPDTPPYVPICICPPQFFGCF